MSGWRRTAANLALGGLALGGLAARAQRPDSATFSGRVVRKADAAPIVGARISFASLHRAATTDSGGRFRFDALPWGLHEVQVQRLGFLPGRDTVTIETGIPVVRTYALEGQLPLLDTVRSVAPNASYLSPTLRAFEERRLHHVSGYFVADSVFRANESSTLGNVIQSRMPGLNFTYVMGMRFAVSARKECQGLALETKCSSPTCFVAIYLDGTLYFNSRISHELPLSAWPDIDRTFSLTNLAGAEYYAGAGTAPPGMHVDDDGCGSLWLWTREK